MNFIKKNKVLFIVLGVATIVAGFMLFKVFSGWGRMRTLDKEVSEKRKRIDELNSEKPAPLEENLVRIKKDTDVIVHKLEKIYPRFGAPYKKSMDAFASKLGLTSDEVRKKWAEFYKKGQAEGENATLTLTKFFRSFDNDKITAAEKAFQKSIKKETLEDINENNLNGCLMEAMGLPRKMDSISCKQFIKNMQTNVLNFLKEKKVNDDVVVLFKDKSVKKFSFEKFDEVMPSPSEVPYIFVHWRMIEDLAKKIKRCKVEYLDSIRRDNLIKGDLKNNFKIYSYTITLRGNMQAIRSFINSMYDAYKDYKIYRIKSLNLTSTDEAGEILSRASIEDASRRLSRKTTRRRGRGRRNSAGVIMEEPKAKLYEPVLGVDDTVTAVIEFDYIVYIGNEIKGGSLK